ncbi:SpoIIE family protein phosphatase (plasmid) [Streptomyces sp. AHU1]|uniref:ATP-binding SpoIIE family protein phosphatase n=1 Tax=Streptomyces sp. AHU1 TaxID=3377215 RepID=UPI003878389F
MTDREWSMLARDILNELTEDLGALAAGIYVEDRANEDLRVVMITGTALTVFSLPERLPLESHQAPALALRFGLVSTTDSIDTGLVPREAVIAPVRNAVTLAAPVSGSQTTAVIAGVWTPRPSSQQLSALHGSVSKMCERLRPVLDSEALVERLNYPPIVLPRVEAAPRVDLQENDVWGLRGNSVSRAFSLMYQAYKLPVSFNRTNNLNEVLAVVHEQIAKPLGAQGHLVVSGSDERLSVVGFSGPLQDVVKRINVDRSSFESPVYKTMEMGLPVFVSDREALIRQFPQFEPTSVEALALLPLRDQRFHGALFITFNSPRTWGSDEQALLVMMAAQLATAISRAKASESAGNLSEALQQRLLPRSLPDFCSVTAVARYSSAFGTSDIGGDWYEAIQLPDGKIALIVGDVQGHGTDSAAVMGQLRSVIRAYASEGHEPTAIIARANDLLAQLEVDRYATCALIVIDTENAQAHIVLAGHCAPLLRRATGEVVLLDAPRNLPLAVQPGFVYSEETVALSAGDLIMMYTDGLFGGLSDVETAAKNALGSAAPNVEGELHMVADKMVSLLDRPSEGHRDDAALLLALFEGPSGASVRSTASLQIAMNDYRGVSRAREWLISYLTYHNLNDLTDDLALAASEIVTNALVHARSEVDIRVREYDDKVHLEVRDSTVAAPMPIDVTSDETANANAEGGRGLTIVDLLASSWGTSANGRGKAVWMNFAKKA